MPSDRDEHGIPRRGSALHLAYYVNCDPEALSEAIADARGAALIHWRSPLADQRFVEYKDRHFLAAVDRSGLTRELGLWWPDSGPRWDALGVSSDGGAVLVEAKANVAEIANGPVCGAGSSGSARGLANRDQIAHSLAATREHFGISHDAASAWLDSHRYQTANRLAHLCFFARLDVPARLAHVYFTDDKTHVSTTAEQFDDQRENDVQAMGLAGVKIAAVVGVYLPAVPDAYERLRAFVV